MASVVIHEFEIEPQPDSQAASAGTAAPSAPAPQTGAQEVERLMRREMERAARVWAH